MYVWPFGGHQALKGLSFRKEGWLEPSWYLLVPGQQWGICEICSKLIKNAPKRRHIQSKAIYLFLYETSFWYFYSWFWTSLTHYFDISIAEFELVNAEWKMQKKKIYSILIKSFHFRVTVIRKKNKASF